MSNSKNSPFDNLQNEIAREKFSALRRITENLSSCLNELESLSVRIDKAIQDNISAQEINKMIETFNSIREDAEEWRYYLIATREASGLFHSNLKADVYKIPQRKKPIIKSEK
jgi:hypothetical protein